MNKIIKKIVDFNNRVYKKIKGIRDSRKIKMIYIPFGIMIILSMIFGLSWIPLCIIVLFIVSCVIYFINNQNS